MTAKSHLGCSTCLVLLFPKLMNLSFRAYHNLTMGNHTDCSENKETIGLLSRNVSLGAIQFIQTGKE